MGIALLAFALASPAAARPEAGSTSSASIGISLSVAPNYRLAQAFGGQALNAASPGRLCLATNGRPTALPVLLVRPSLDRSADVKQLPWCEASSPAVEEAVRGTGSKATGLLIIRPE